MAEGVGGVEIRQLEIFVAAAERGSITQAADALLVAQPSASAQIRTLEAELGHRLFDRLPRGVRVTEVGQAVLPHARQILRGVAEIGAAVDELAGLRRGRLVLGAMPTITAYLIPTAIKAFREAFPGVELRVVEARTSTLLDDVAALRLDLAVATLTEEPDPQIEVEALAEEELFAIVAAGDPLADGGEIGLADLRERPFVMLEHGFGLKAIVVEACRQAGFAPRVAQEMQSLQAIKGLVEIGVGVSLAPRLVVEQEERLGLLRALRLRPPRPYRRVQIVTRRGAYLSRAAQAFIGICREEARRRQAP